MPKGGMARNIKIGDTLLSLLKQVKKEQLQNTDVDDLRTYFIRE